YTDGQLLIGNSTGNTLAKATLTGTSNQVVVTNGSGAITLSLPQSIATASNVHFSDVLGDGDIYTVAWMDYSATSTIVVWTSFTSKLIFYKKIGKDVFVQFELTGTSNATTSTFTLPFTMANSVDLYGFI